MPKPIALQQKLDEKAKKTEADLQNKGEGVDVTVNPTAPQSVAPNPMYSCAIPQVKRLPVRLASA